MKNHIAILVMLLVLPLGITQAKSVGESAPDFTLTTDGGNTFNLSDQRGKVVFLFLFGNTCPSCIANAPNTESIIYQNLKNNANFVAVGADVWDGSLGLVQSFKSSTGVTYPLLQDASSLKTSYSTNYDRVIVIDQQGIIRFKSTSGASSSVLNQAKSVIDNLLQTADIDAPSAVEFKAYVNRAAQQLVFNKPYVSDELTEVRVMDMSGRIIYQRQEYLTDDNRIPFNPSHKGLYFIHVSNNEGVHFEKIIY